MADLIIGLIVVVLAGLAIGYIVRAKKRGVTCIGCSQAGTCSMKSQGGCSCCSVPEDFKLKK